MWDTFAVAFVLALQFHRLVSYWQISPTGIWFDTTRIIVFSSLLLGLIFLIVVVRSSNNNNRMQLTAIVFWFCPWRESVGMLLNALVRVVFFERAVELRFIVQ